jgi:hypothetical protein
MKTSMIFLLITLLQPSIIFANAKVIGNGGNIKNDRHVTATEIGKSLGVARLDLIYIANFLERNKEIHTPASNNNYESFRNAVYDHGILYDNYPCYDHNGNETDASTASRDQNKICLNIASLTAKLKVSDYRPQILGLLAHEYSHFVGASETEANLLQKRIVSLVSLTRDTPEMQTEIVTELDRINYNIETALSLPRLDMSSLYLVLINVRESLNKIYVSETIRNGYNYFSNTNRTKILELRLQTANWSLSLCERILRKNNGTSCKHELDQIYQGQKNVRLIEFSRSFPPSEENLLNPTVSLNRNDSTQEIKSGLQSIFIQIRQIKKDSTR